MTRKSLFISTILSATLLCGSLTLAQEPVLNVDRNRHPNLAEAQRLVAQAYSHITEAQQDNRYDMHGHASKAKALLVQVNEELKRAAEDANLR